MPWDVLLLVLCTIEVLGVRWLCSRAFRRGYQTAAEVYSLRAPSLGAHTDGSPCTRPGTGCNTQGCPDTAEYWDRQWALSQEPKKA